MTTDLDCVLAQNTIQGIHGSQHGLNFHACAPGTAIVNTLRFQEGT
jgi:hypothetical protein